MFLNIRKKKEREREQHWEVLKTDVRLKCYFCHPGKQMSLVKGKTVTWERKWERNSAWSGRCRIILSSQTGWDQQRCWAGAECGDLKTSAFSGHYFAAACWQSFTGTAHLNWGCHSYTCPNRDRRHTGIRRRVESWALHGNLCLVIPIQK